MSTHRTDKRSARHSAHGPLRRKLVPVVVRGHEAFARAADVALLRPVLSRSVNRFRVGGPTGVVRWGQLAGRYRLDKPGLVRFGAGLVPRVEAHLRALGHDVEIQRLPTLDDRPREAALLTSLELDDESRRFLQAIDRSPWGQIVLQRPGEVVWHLALIGRFFPMANIFLAARNSRQAWQLCRKLQPLIDRPVTCDGSVWRQYPRMFIANASLHGVAYLDEWGLVVLADTELALAQRSIEQAALWPDVPRYCFLDGGRPMSDSERFQLEEVYGPVIYGQAADGKQTGTVRVLCLAGPAKRSEPRMSAGLERKRSLWHAPDRNRLIAQVARAIQHGKLQELVASGAVDLVRGDADGPALDELPEQPRVAILVESTEHGRALKHCLPGWDLLTLRTCSTIPIATHREIVTLTCAEQWGIQSDVLLRVDGGPAWPLAGKFPRSGGNGTCWLIDLIDNRDDATLADAEGRLEA